MLKTPIHLLQSCHWRHRRVGLLGGSFNPPHHGHIHISRMALRFLRLDAVWWLVTPGNPLKDPAAYMPMTARLHMAESCVADESRILATDIEYSLGTTRTYDTLRSLRGYFPQTDFVFLLGVDNALSFHQWYKWREIPQLAALAVLGRPPAAEAIRSCPLRQARQYRHRVLSRAEFVDLSPSSCFWLTGHPLADVSSTEIRKSFENNVL